MPRSSVPGSATSRTTSGVDLLYLEVYSSRVVGASLERKLSDAARSNPSQNASKFSKAFLKNSKSTFLSIFLAGNFFPIEVFKKPFSKLFIARLDTFVG